MSPKYRHLFACLLFGCIGQLNAGPSGRDTMPGEPNAPSSEAQLPKPPGIALMRGLGPEAELIEVWLDPRASAALTRDKHGDVCLWPVLPSSQRPLPKPVSLDELAPIRLPVRHPRWLSLARTGERSFVVAAIDDAQAGRVLEIRIDDSGNATAHERAAIPPRDPLLELHVLDGGERLLALANVERSRERLGLGFDNRIRLYDGAGKLLSELTEPRRAPWELRVVGPPEAVQLAMVLPDPIRVQRFTIKDDRLAKHGEARAFALDPWANLDTLTLLPSGRTAAVLRRPEAKGQQWSLELHDLDSGEVRVLWGEVEAKWRPRLHIVDDEWALLEDGIAGYWIDLRRAVVMPAPFELPKKLADLPKQSHVTTRRVPLPGTSHAVRRHTSVSVVAGLRVVLVDRALVLDPVPSTPPAGGERHHRLGHRAVSIRGLDFESAGELLAIAYPDKIVVEHAITGSEQPGGCAAEHLLRVAFTDPDHLLLLGQNQARICAWRTGQVVATLELPKPTDIPDISEIERAIIHPSGPGAGEIGLRRSSWSTESAVVFHLTRTRFANNQFSVLEPLPQSKLRHWPELDDKWQAGIIDAAGNRYLATQNATRKLTITLASGQKRNLALVESGAPEIDIWQIEPSRDGRYLAIVTGIANSDDFFHESLSIWSTASEPAERLWSTPISANAIELAWTDDGSRLAMEHAGGLRVITPRGDVLLDRTSRDFQLEELPDEPSKTAQPRTKSPSPTGP
jgi:hypothetical protein